MVNSINQLKLSEETYAQFLSGAFVLVEICNLERVVEMSYKIIQQQSTKNHDKEHVKQFKAFLVRCEKAMGKD